MGRPRATAGSLQTPTREWRQPRASTSRCGLRTFCDRYCVPGIVEVRRGRHRGSTQTPDGAPAFQEGRWWTVFRGPWFGLTPGQNISLILLGGAGLGVGEGRLGARRTLRRTEDGSNRYGGLRPVPRSFMLADGCSGGCRTRFLRHCSDSLRRNNSNQWSLLFHQCTDSTVDGRWDSSSGQLDGLANSIDRSGCTLALAVGITVVILWTRRKR